MLSKFYESMILSDFHRELSPVVLRKIHRFSLTKRSVDLLPLIVRNPKRGRLFDIVISSALLVVHLPVFLLIALLIKLDSAGPVFYSQTRVGMNRRRVNGLLLDRGGLMEAVFYGTRRNNTFGRPFKVYKFRSMYLNAESDGFPVWCKDEDPRVTRVGRFLRKTHLDELPQLFNILKGEMSLVGPRPERPGIVDELVRKVPGYQYRHLVRPGVTGLAQTRHRSDRHLGDVRRKIRYDRFYLQHRSIFTDIKIIFETLPISLGMSIEKLKRLRRRSPVMRFFQKGYKSSFAPPPGFNRREKTKFQTFQPSIN